MRIKGSNVGDDAVRHLMSVEKIKQILLVPLGTEYDENISYLTARG